MTSLRKRAGLPRRECARPPEQFARGSNSTPTVPFNAYSLEPQRCRDTARQAASGLEDAEKTLRGRRFGDPSRGARIPERAALHLEAVAGDARLSSELRAISGGGRIIKPHIIIVGAGATGLHLARRLAGSWQITLVDRSAEVLSAVDANGPARVPGDGSSRLVLKEAGAESARALVACTGSDEVNLEVLRLAAELGVEDRHAIMRSQASEAAYRKHGVEPVNLRDACSALLESRIQGHKVATAVGLGEGEIIEVRVMAGSSTVGARLRDLHPRKWLVGAIYRDGRLVVPHGDTTIETNDRVLLIGDPGLLPSIASHLRTGEPEFPLHFGTNLVVATSSATPALCEEMDYLLRFSAARGAVLVTAAGTDVDAAALEERCSRAGKPLTRGTASDASEASLLAEAEIRDAGLIVLPPARLPFLCKIGMTQSSLARLARRARVPLLVARGTVPYLRVMVVLSEVPFDQRAAQLAIDLVRTVGGKLCLGIVHQPELVVGAQTRGELEAERRQTEELARMFRVELQVKVMEGNPIVALARESREVNALVIPYSRQRRPSLMRPDVAQNLAHLARCSVYLLPC